ncbi:MAG: dihydropteroate synthase [Anaerolineales bacterium]|nr:MAG: dihydropteroate synthase [Anaerolineales bacterium]
MSRYGVRLLRCDGEASLRKEMEAVGADPRGIAIMAPKGSFHLFKLEGLTFAAASILKQEMLSKGGEAVLSGDIYFGGERTTDVLLMATERTLREVLKVLRMQPLPSLRQLAEELAAALRHHAGPEYPCCRIGGREFRWGERTYVMGIVNVTPDSFSGDGVYATMETEGVAHPLERAQAATERAVAQALSFLEEGVDIIDVGGESTRPGSAPIDAQTELSRVIPVIRRLREATDAPISIDTYKASVAAEALDAGADLVNAVWALQMDPELAPLVAERGVPVILMHNRSKPKNAAQQERLGGRYVGIHYHDLMADIIRELRQRVEHAVQAGIPRSRIIIDPGIGFGKTVEQNLHLLNHVDELRVLGLPILAGPSRKSFIGYTLDLPPQERQEGTAAAVALCIARGVNMVRVHDARAMVRVVRMSDAILRAGRA